MRNDLIITLSPSEKSLGVFKVTDRGELLQEQGQPEQASSERDTVIKPSPFCKTVPTTCGQLFDIYLFCQRTIKG